MGKEILTFEDIKIEKKKIFFTTKTPVPLRAVEYLESISI